MKSKAWWKKHWSEVFGVVCGIVSITSASLVLGPLVPMMLVVGLCTAALARELWDARHDD